MTNTKVRHIVRQFSVLVFIIADAASDPKASKRERNSSNLCKAAKTKIFILTTMHSDINHDASLHSA